MRPWPLCMLCACLALACTQFPELDAADPRRPLEAPIIRHCCPLI